jgi:8-oxo-dGTP pyrophosphatase MutT (NUDIX family)
MIHFGTKIIKQPPKPSKEVWEIGLNIHPLIFFLFRKHILTNKICAIRETFEESGLLLSNPPAHTIKELDINEWRHKVHDDASQFKIMCNKFNIRPATQNLIPFSNWITPFIEKKRYDTFFFLTVLNQFKTQQEHDKYYHLVAADGKETVLFQWLKPEEALQLQKDKKILTIPPQWYSLNLLSQIPNYGELIEKAGVGSFKSKDGQVISILPHAQPAEENSQQAKEGYKVFLAYPGDETYDSNQYTSKKGDRHRLYFKGRMEEFKLEKNIDVSNIIINKTSNL